jgi:hypothetical protein
VRRLLITPLIAMLGVKLGAQSTMTSDPMTPAADVTRAAASAILSRLTRELAQTDGDTTSRLWFIEMPSDSSSVDWAAVRATIMVRLRARPPRLIDASFRTLVVERVERSETHVKFELELGGATRCTDALAGSSATYRVDLQKADGIWTPRLRQIAVSDGVGCSTPWTPRTAMPPLDSTPRVRPTRIPTAR